jgi:hypothetical protein
VNELQKLVNNNKARNSKVCGWLSRSCCVAYQIDLELYMNKIDYKNRKRSRH